MAPACRAANLHAPLFLQGATGSLVGGVTLTNRGRACALLGWPRAAFAGSAAQATKWQVRRVASSFEPPNPLADPPGSLRALSRGKSARVALVWSNWCGPGSEAAGSSRERPTALVLSLASKTRLRLPLTRAPRCDSPTTPSKLTVEPFRPFVPQLPPSSQLQLRLAVVRPGSTTTNRGLVLLRARGGTLLRYRVSLTNTSERPFRFAACPAYVEQLSDAPPRAYVLNCRPAGTIAPRATRLFAIALPISSKARLGSSELTFQLAPRTFNAPIAQAAVLVVR